MEPRGRNGRMTLGGHIPSCAVDGELVVAVDCRGALAAWQRWNPTPQRAVAKARAGRANAVVLGRSSGATAGWEGAARLWDRERFAPRRGDPQAP